MTSKATGAATTVMRVPGMCSMACLLGPLLCAFMLVRPAWAAPISGDELDQALLASLQQRLGVEVQFERLADWPSLKVESSASAINVRYPARNASSLPEAVEIRVASRLEACIPLVRYVQFRLPVVVSPNGISLRALVSASDLELEERTLPAGSECSCSLDTLLGLETRAAVLPGSVVLASRLRRTADVKRGSSVTIVMHLKGLEVRVEGIAMADAYIGQRISVRRQSDRQQFSGLLVEGPAVEVE